MSQLNSSERTYFWWFPTLDHEQRKELSDHFNESAIWNVDFVFMLGLSTALAALGLLLNSGAVVIGAMLVAPLMSPLIAAGFSVVQGNLHLFAKTMRALSYGLVMALAVAFGIGLVSGTYEPTLEVLARTEVNILDLAVALFSGMAAAYATGRPQVAGTLAGVAIAAALVPPLAVVGLALAMGRFQMAGLAATLFVANVVAIVLGAGLLFRWLGVAGSLGDERGPLWARRLFLTLMLATGLLVIPLGRRLATQTRIGQARPVSYPLSTPVRKSVYEVLENWPGVSPLFMGRSAVEPESGVSIFLSCERPVGRELDMELTGAVRSALADETIPVSVVPVRAAWNDVVSFDDTGS